MNKDQVKGAVKEATGKVQKKVGTVIDSDERDRRQAMATRSYRVQLPTAEESGHGRYTLSVNSNAEQIV